MDWMDLLVAQRDHGIGLGRTAGGDIATQSSYANQNYFNKSLRLVTRFWIFTTQAPRTSNALPNINLLSCLNGRILRLPITHLDEEMSAVISKLESCSNLLVIQRRALAEGFAPA
jgi:hypothetical protein